MVADVAVNLSYTSGGIVKIYPAHFFAVMSAVEYSISACVALLLACSASIEAASPGFLEGHLQIFSSKEVELADGTPASMTVESYAEFPLIILSSDRKGEVARITADANGNYHLALPPGDYVLDIKGRRRGHIRATPQTFKIVSNQTVRVDMSIDTGVR